MCDKCLGFPSLYLYTTHQHILVDIPYRDTFLCVGGRMKREKKKKTHGVCSCIVCFFRIYLAYTYYADSFVGILTIYTCITIVMVYTYKRCLALSYAIQTLTPTDSCFLSLLYGTYLCYGIVAFVYNEALCYSSALLCLASHVIALLSVCDCGKYRISGQYPQRCCLFSSSPMVSSSSLPA